MVDGHEDVHHVRIKKGSVCVHTTENVCKSVNTLTNFVNENESAF